MILYIVLFISTFVVPCQSEMSFIQYDEDALLAYVESVESNWIALRKSINWGRFGPVIVFLNRVTGEKQTNRIEME